MIRALLAVAALALSMAPVPTGRPAAIAWTNGMWFDGRTFVRVDVYSEGSRLTLERPRTIGRTVDLGGRHIVPAFGEAHNHNLPGPDVPGTIRRYLEQGIFYVMIQGNSPTARDEIRGLVNQPGSVHAVFANGIFTAPGGHPSALVERNIARGGMSADDRDGGFLHPVSSTNNIDRAWWQAITPQHPDFIKLVLAYSEDRVAGIPRPSSDRHGLDPALVPYLVHLAHRHHLRVSAHVESAYDFQVAVTAGVDVIAHLPGFWPDPSRLAASGAGIYTIGEAQARLAAQHHITVITTIGESLHSLAAQTAATERQAHPELAALKPQLLEIYRHNLDVLVRNGVRIAIGSDQFRSTSVPEALEIAQAGLMSKADLLRALSSDAAAVILPSMAPFGLVDGAQADFLALEGNPLEDFSAVTRITLRVKDGQELALPPAHHE